MINVPKISIIIPVYNAEKYLQRCIDSVISQSFTDFELLLINDGSNDKSGDICDEYSTKDYRILVFHKKNGGVSSARNLGIENAKGKWIVFIDSDDVVCNDYLDILISNCTEDDVFVMANYMTSNGILSNIEGGLYQGDEIIELIYTKKLLSLSAPYSKLYNANILRKNKIVFNENIHMGEDGLFLTNYLFYVDKLNFISNISYIVSDTEGSLSKCYNNLDSEMECLIIWHKLILSLIAKYNINGDDAERIIWNGRIGETFVRILKIIALSREFESINDRIQKYYHLNNSYYRLYFLYYTPPSIYLKVCKLLIKHKLFVAYIFLETIKNILKYGKYSCEYKGK